MPFTTGQTIAGEIDGDSTPSATLVVNGIDSAAVVTISAIATGRYKWSCTAPTLASGDNVELVVLESGVSRRHWWAVVGSPGATLAGRICCDGVPTAFLVVNGAGSTAATITSIATGLFKWALTAPTITSGDNVELIVTAEGVTNRYWWAVGGATNSSSSDASQPISERITRNIVDTLKGITNDNGYENDVDPADVVRPNPGLGATFTDLKIVVHQGDPEPLGGGIQIGRGWRMPIEIVCAVAESTASSTTIENRLNSIAADVEKILMVDFHRNSLAHRTIIGNRDDSPVEPNAHVGAVTVNVDIEYRTRWNDPYTVQ